MESPIACSLDTEGKAVRGIEWRDLAGAAISVERGDRVIRLVFPSEEEAAVRDLVRMEKECCPFFDFRFEKVDAGLVLEIGAPEEAMPILVGLYESMSA